MLCAAGGFRPTQADDHPLADRHGSGDRRRSGAQSSGAESPSAGRLVGHLATLLIARQSGAIVGSAALEVYPDGALLRSVAVVPELQGHGLGRELTNAAIHLAQDLQVTAIYLLTTTAEEYFPQFGFERIARADVPATVQTSIEFTSACPSSAVVMRKAL
jgi:amino-acid N-acetyltransferase